MEIDIEKLNVKSKKILKKILEDNNGNKLQCFVDCKELDRLIKALTIIVINETYKYVDAPDELREVLKELRNIGNVEEFYIEYQDDKLEVFADKQIPELKIEQIKGYDDLKGIIEKRLSPLLKEGVEYVSSAYIDETGNYTVGTDLNELENGKPLEYKYVFLSGPENHFLLNLLDKLYKTFQVGSITQIIASKDKSLQTKICDPSEMLEDMRLEFNREIKRKEFDKIDYTASFERELLHQLEKDKKSFSCIMEGFSIKGDKKESIRDVFISTTRYEYLYMALDKSISELKVEITKDETNFFADVEFPEYGIKKLESDESESHKVKPFLLTDELKDLKEIIFNIKPDTDISIFNEIQGKSYKLLLEKIQNAINPQLKEDYEYIHEFIVDEEGNGRNEIKTSFYGHKDGVKHSREIIFFLNEENEKIYELLRWLSSTLPFGKKIKVIARKDKPLEIKECSPLDIINDIKSEFEENIKEAVLKGEEDKILVEIKKVERKKSVWLKSIMYLECVGYLLRGGKKEYIDYTPHWGSLTEYEALYLSIEKSVDKMRIEVTQDEFRIFADKEFKEFGIKKFKMSQYVVSSRKKIENIEKDFPDAEIIDVTSKADSPWVKFSPFYPHGNIPVPYSDGYFSKSVEGIWQALKVFESSDVDENKLETESMKEIKRTVKKFGKVKGHRKGVQGKELLSYGDARVEIYLPTYKWVLENCLKDELEKLREINENKDLVLLDYETNTDIKDLSKPLSHASLIIRYLNNQI